MSMTIARERALEGAAFLDRERPGWDENINLLNLNLRSPWSCVLGQVFADKTVPNSAWSGYDWAVNQYDELNGTGSDYGFEESQAYRSGQLTRVVSYKELYAAWEELIEARRDQRAAYATYEQNIAISKAYEWADSVIDEIVLYEDQQSKILTINDIARDLADVS